MEATSGITPTQTDHPTYKDKDILITYNDISHDAITCPVRSVTFPETTNISWFRNSSWSINSNISIITGNNGAGKTKLITSLAHKLKLQEEDMGHKVFFLGATLQDATDDDRALYLEVDKSGILQSYETGQPFQLAPSQLNTKHMKKSHAISYRSLPKYIIHTYKHSAIRKAFTIKSILNHYKIITHLCYS